MRTVKDKTKRLARARTSLDLELAGASLTEAQRRVAVRRRDAIISDMVELNRGLIAVHIRKWGQSTDIDRDSIEGAGLAGLCEAAVKFDPDKGLFSSYALRFIRAEIHNTVRITCFPSLTAHAFGLRPKVMKLVRAGDTPNEVAEELGVARSTVDAIMETVVIRLDLEVHEGQFAVHDVYDIDETCTQLVGALTALSEKDRYIVTQRLGLQGERKTTTELAQELSVSHQAVSKREQKALKLMRAYITEYRT